jgi:hypothetical protein
MGRFPASRCFIRTEDRALSRVASGNFRFASPTTPCVFAAMGWRGFLPLWVPVDASPPVVVGLSDCGGARARIPGRPLYG